MEHLHHFKLNDDPFRNEPDLQLFFDSGAHRDAWRRLDRGARQARGLSVLVAESGAGKTMVVRRLLEGLEEEAFEASMIVVVRGAGDAQSLMARFAAQLGVEQPASDRKGLLGQIYEQLAIVREDGRHAVLIIDDADTLVTEGALAEMCGLLKLEYEDRRLLSLVLAGTQILERALMQDELMHRVDVKVRLASLDAEATKAYLDHRVKAAGGSIALLEADALSALQALGHGLPGRMNTLADNALFEAFLCGRNRISRTDVERAGRDLGWKPGNGAVPSEPGEASAKLPLANLDAELDAAFDLSSDDAEASAEPLELIDTEPPLAEAALPDDGPPKVDDEDIEDLLVELVEE